MLLERVPQAALVPLYLSKPFLKLLPLRRVVVMETPPQKFRVSLMFAHAISYGEDFDGAGEFSGDDGFPSSFFF